MLCCISGEFVLHGMRSTSYMPPHEDHTGVKKRGESVDQNIPKGYNNYELVKKSVRFTEI